MADKPKEEPEVPEVNEEESPAETPNEEPKEKIEPEEEPKEETPEESRAEEPEETAEEESKPPSRREQLRVQDLLRKYGPPKEKAPQTTPDFRDKVQADEDVYKTLEETAQDYGQTQYQQGIAQANTAGWKAMLTLEDRQVRKDYPIFNPQDKEKFHPAVADAMNTKYLRAIGYNPGDPQRGIPETVVNPISYYEFVEAEMEFADELAAQRVERTTENIARQAAQTGLRPDGSSAKSLNLNKAPEDMTDEELDAAIAATLPKK